MADGEQVLLPQSRGRYAITLTITLLIATPECRGVILEHSGTVIAADLPVRFAIHVIGIAPGCNAITSRRLLGAIMEIEHG